MDNKAVICVGGYIRVSTDETRQRNSLAVQEKRLREYVRSRYREGYRLSKIYTDRCSGENICRPGLNRLLDDAENGHIYRILIVSLDRLCRDVYDKMYLFCLLDTWEIKLERINQDIEIMAL